MMRFYLFVWEAYDQGGGAWDFYSFHETAEAAIETARELEMENRRAGWRATCWHVTNENMEIIGEDE